ncbi:hypothetical protein CONPUDRAFT_167323 [Coniophora puteana RWD-64-598 SS2]|uniref:MYND-type domain-containing protein n=1 Tax=Coniophora puteana (strain RWD-64-598) TaxID=741705 RepID=A0A5M3MGD7_CONPW|nr:uncharacterized protein CONPUDRAFT_167323 [Coniophora puteana RWD-64-598 SS2]EIW78282.1 hypothetical protein CONPUDRAFT_167323 [Coniophora puteana RWD-64-598 SS2]
MSTTPGSGGFTIPADMRAMLSKPEEYISSKNGGETLRKMYQAQSTSFNPNLLSHFALSCYLGIADEVKKLVSSGAAPDLTGHETAFHIGYVAFAVLGSQRVVSGPKSALHYLVLVRYLLECGASPDIPDVPVLYALQGRNVELLSLLIDHGADLTMKDANGDSFESLYVHHGANLTAAISQKIRKLTGEEGLMEDKNCANCHKRRERMKQCSACHTTMYCSTECQQSHWKAHKPSCNPFSGKNTVTLKLTYMPKSNYLEAVTVSSADVTQRLFGGVPDDGSKLKESVVKSTREASNKGMVIKIQAPVDTDTGAMLIYNKKRDFQCFLHRESCPAAYDEVLKVIRAHGPGRPRGLKAYFASYLKSKDELVVKASEVLAEQPF